jgi:hypothetical protein
MPVKVEKPHGVTERISHCEQLQSLLERQLSRLEQRRSFNGPQRSGLGGQVPDRSDQQESVAVRRQILDAGPAPHQHEEASQLPRNEAPLRGHVRADMFVIESISSIDPERTAAWKQTFVSLYALDYDTCKGQMRVAPPELISLCNILGTLRLDPSWAGAWPDYELFDYSGLCENLLNRWKHAVGFGCAAIFWSDPVYLETFRKIDTWYHARMNAATIQRRQSSSVDL